MNVYYSSSRQVVLHFPAWGRPPPLSRTTNFTNYLSAPTTPFVAARHLLSTPFLSGRCLLKDLAWRVMRITMGENDAPNENESARAHSLTNISPIINREKQQHEKLTFTTHGQSWQPAAKRNLPARSPPQRTTYQAHVPLDRTETI